MLSIQQCAKIMNKGNVSIPLLLLEHYKKIKLNELEMVLLIHIHSFIVEGVHFPSFDQLLDRMTCSQMELSGMLNRLHKEGYIDLDQSKNGEGKMEEAYSLEPLWVKLLLYINQENVEAEIACVTDEVDKVDSLWPSESIEGSKKMEGEIFKRFEQEFGRPLSPIECETIIHWIDTDHYDSQLIFLALKEAVIANKLSLRYIDRILFEWQKNGLKTPEHIREHSRKFRQSSLKPVERDQEKKKTEFSFYNWLEK